MSLKDEKEKEALNKEGTEKGNPLNREDSMAKEKDARKYKLGIALFSVLNVLLLALIAITAYYVATEKKVTVVRDTDICVPCEDIRLHPDDTTEGIDKRGEKKETCCATDKDGPDALIGYFIDHWLKKKLATEKREFTRYQCQDNPKYTNRKPLIKLVGKADRPTVTHNVLWNGKSDIAIDEKDYRIKHHEEHGIIELGQSGLYQIYSQVVFEHDHDQSDSRYQHTINLIRPGTPGNKIQRKILLKASNTYCKSNSDKQTVSSYISGAFQLIKGDRLVVKAHNMSEIVPIPHMNFFGVYML